MDAHIYFLYSSSIDKYYIGSTELLPAERLKLHLNKNYGTLKFTAKTTDWQLYWSHECTNISQARDIERHIKRMKSKKYLNNLKKHPEIIQKLIEKFTGSSR